MKRHEQLIVRHLMYLAFMGDGYMSRFLRNDNTGGVRPFDQTQCCAMPQTVMLRDGQVFAHRQDTSRSQHSSVADHQCPVVKRGVLEDYPYKELSGCGVGFKLVQAYALRRGIEMTSVYRFLPLLAMSIASDIVPLTGENRILSRG